MSAVDTQSDVELVQDHEFEPETPCEVAWVRPPLACGKAAQGYVHCKACNLTLAASWECWERSVATVGLLGGGVRCARCDAWAVHLEDLYEFVPFGGTR